jgi:hypothetical protein
MQGTTQQRIGKYCLCSANAGRVRKETSRVHLEGILEEVDYREKCNGSVCVCVVGVILTY